MTSGALAFISRAFTRRPLITNMLVTGGLFAAGDISQQTVRGVDHYDWSNTARIALVTMTFNGPAYMYWYRFLDRWRMGNLSVGTIVAKVFADQFIMAPPGLVAFFGGTRLLERKDDVFKDVREKLPTAFMLGLFFWPPVQSINFRFVPSHLRVVYVAGLSFIWTNVLCYIKSMSTEELVDPDEQRNST